MNILQCYFGYYLLRYNEKILSFVRSCFVLSSIQIRLQNSNFRLKVKSSQMTDILCLIDLIHATFKF